MKTISLCFPAHDVLAFLAGTKTVFRVPLKDQAPDGASPILTEKGLRFQLPDLTFFPGPNKRSATNFIECKGPHAWDDSIVKLKAAAAIHKKLIWLLYWKENGQWYSQNITQ